MAVNNYIFTPTFTERIEYDVIGERGGRWTVFRSGCTREQAELELEAARIGSPSSTWFLIKRTHTVTEELLDNKDV